MINIFRSLKNAPGETRGIRNVTPRLSEPGNLKDRDINEYGKMLKGVEWEFSYVSPKSESRHSRKSITPTVPLDSYDINRDRSGKDVLNIAPGRYIPFARNALKHGAKHVTVLGPAFKAGLGLAERSDPLFQRPEESYREMALDAVDKDADARDKKDRLTLVEGYGENMDLPDNSFDEIASCFGVPMYCNGEEGKKNFFRHIWRIMRPSGEARFFPAKKEEVLWAIDAIEKHGRRYGKKFEIHVFKTTMSPESERMRLLIIRKLP